MLKFLAVLLFAFSGLVQAQNSLHTDLPLKYLAQASAEVPNKPLVIFIHGSGANEADLFVLKDLLSPDYNYLSVQAPIEVRPGGYKWFNRRIVEGNYDGETADLKNSGELITAFIRQATQKYRTQPEKVVLVGFSQGAVMSYEVALRDPDLVTGIAALSGPVLSVLQASLKPEERFKTFKVFIAHGTADPVLPFSGATRTNVTLKGLGIKPEFHAYEGMGHAINREEIADLKQWLEQTL
ncbi:alpha/beta hydrolase [Pseudomonas sp. NPDC089734]|uniref:alpha/beta hydrolase n=1 Tax=Pseudomonas sp. NPDC089734 TaxID=3364469 RepID=UPI0037F36E5E